MSLDIEAASSAEQISFLNSCRERIRKADSERSRGLAISAENIVTDEELSTAIRLLHKSRAATVSKSQAKRAAAMEDAEAPDTDLIGLLEASIKQAKG